MREGSLRIKVGSKVLFPKGPTGYRMHIGRICQIVSYATMYHAMLCGFGQCEKISGFAT